MDQAMMLPEASVDTANANGAGASDMGAEFKFVKVSTPSEKLYEVNETSLNDKLSASGVATVNEPVMLSLDVKTPCAVGKNEVKSLPVYV
jgi:hypothetical protein